MVGKMRKFTLILVTLQLLHQAKSFKVVSYTQDEKVTFENSLNIILVRNHLQIYKWIVLKVVKAENFLKQAKKDYGLRDKVNVVDVVDKEDDHK